MISKIEQPYTELQLKAVLHPLINQWFFSRFKEFSLPQLYGVMEIHSRKNVLISAPTGSGKTLTAFLSIINELVDSAKKGILEEKVYCLYVSPLKALGNDIQVNLLAPLKEINELAGKDLGLRVAVRTGDTTAAEKAKMLKHTPHILITTPESLAILLNSPKFKEKLNDVQWLIVDEIHSLAENKRGVHLNLSMERLQRLSPGMARIGLSATIAPLEEIAKYLVGYSGGGNSGEGNEKEPDSGVRDCGLVDISFLKEMELKVLSPVKDLLDTDYMLKHNKMYSLIDELIQEHRTTLIFTNTRSATERVVHNLKEMFPQHYAGGECARESNDCAQKSNNRAQESNNSGDELIAAHHGSLSKQNRFKTEQALREGKLKVVVSSTSLELGIDIGYIDLVLCLGSPKSVARFLQRSGRGGHKLHDLVKARIIVMDRDDLVECSLLLKSAIEKKIDHIRIPKNALDVLAQHIFGVVINEKINIYELFHLLKKSYCYHELSWDDFFAVIKYLAGEYASLEERHVYARIWRDAETGELGRRGKMARTIYMTNIGTIPEESYVIVKVGEQVVGKIDEAFLERLRPGDVFVLGGEVYMFKFSRGMTAQVSASINRPPTVPSWFSEMLPLSYDLAGEISRFRRLMEEKFNSKSAGKKTEQEILQFIHNYLYVDENSAQSIYNYFYEQYRFSKIPSDRKIVIETYIDRECEREDGKWGNNKGEDSKGRGNNWEDGKWGNGKERDDKGRDSKGRESKGRTYTIFHTLFGRRVNDCLSRALAYVVGKSQHRDVEMGITDNGFYLSAEKSFNAAGAFELLRQDEFRSVLENAIEKSEVLSRRFRHCASRSLMILRQYGGKKKNAGMMQVGSKILFNAVKRIDNNFPILKEARREVLEDLMDYAHAREIINKVNSGEIEIAEVNTDIPSPFAFGLISEGYSDVIRIEDKQEFLRRMHKLVMAKIALKEGKQLLKEGVNLAERRIEKRRIEKRKSENYPDETFSDEAFGGGTFDEPFSYTKLWEKAQRSKEEREDLYKEKLKMQVWRLKHVPIYAKEELVKLIESGNMRKDVFDECRKYRENIEKEWPEELKKFMLGKML
ncbi:MAG: ATP-dependent helicase [Nanoarchaeota archaeon]